METEQEARTLERNPGSDLSVTPPIRLRVSVWCVAAIAGFLQMWTSRFFITPDGNSYLDVATAYLRHDWSSALNGWWSPMLSWILGGVIYFTKLPPFWETPAIHVVDFAGFLVSLFSFEFFLRALLKKMQPAQIDRSTWWLLGYSLFLSTSLYVLDLSNPTPDVWVAAATYLASGIIVRIRGGATSHTVFACLGVVLALGYLYQGLLFPVELRCSADCLVRHGRAAKDAIASNSCRNCILSTVGTFCFRPLARQTPRYLRGHGSSRLLHVHRPPTAARILAG